MLTSLFSLFYATGECHRFFTEDESAIGIRLSSKTIVSI